MTRSATLVIAAGLVLAGCSGGSNSSSASQSSASQGAGAQATAAAPAATEAPVTTDLPVYPGATKDAMVGNITVSRCGHKMSIATYDVSGTDAGAVTDWYSSRLPGAIRISKDVGASAGTGMSMTELVEPSGGRIAAITLAKSPEAVRIPGGALHVSLSNVDPPFSSAELATMQAAMGSDPAAKQQALDKMKAKCGPDSVRGL